MLLFFQCGFIVLKPKSFSPCLYYKKLLRTTSQQDNLVKGPYPLQKHICGGSVSHHCAGSAPHKCSCPRPADAHWECSAPAPSCQWWSGRTVPRPELQHTGADSCSLLAARPVGLADTSAGSRTCSCQRCISDKQGPVPAAPLMAPSRSQSLLGWLNRKR